MTNMTNQQLGARIVAARKQLGVTQNELAVMLSIPPSTVSRWESGKYAINALELLRVVETTKLPIGFFLPVGAYEPYWYEAYCQLHDKLKQLAKEG